MRVIAANLCENKKDLLVVILIQISVAVGSYFIIPGLFN